MSTDALTGVRIRARGLIEPSGARFVLVCLADFADTEWSCYPRISIIAEYTAQGDATIRRHLKQLEDDGWIKRVRTRRPDGKLGGYRYYLSIEKLSLEDEHRDGQRSNRAVEASAQNDHVADLPVGEKHQDLVESERLTTAQSGRALTANSSLPADSLSMTERRVIIDQILSVCGPGLADPSRFATPKLSLVRRLPYWLSQFDLDEDILPVIEAQTARARRKPVHDVACFEDDLFAHHAARIADLKPSEHSNEAAQQGSAAGRGQARPAYRSDEGQHHRGASRPQHLSASLVSAALRSRRLREEEDPVSEAGEWGDDVEDGGGHRRLDVIAGN